MLVCRSERVCTTSVGIIVCGRPSATVHTHVCAYSYLTRNGHAVYSGSCSVVGMIANHRALRLGQLHDPGTERGIQAIRCRRL